MTIWAATKAKAQFSALLDKVETEGPQLVQRGQKNFVLLTEQQHAQRRELPKPELPYDPQVSQTLTDEIPTGEITSGQRLWEFLSCPPDDGVDPVFPRLGGKQRTVSF